jgi:hypothetical protein
MALGISEKRRPRLRILVLTFVTAALVLGAIRAAQLLRPPEDARAGLAAGTDDSCRPPYTDSSPWNTPIGLKPRYHPESARLIRALDGDFGSNPDAYTYPVHEVSSQTPLARVELSGLYSEVVEEGTKVLLQRRVTVDVPIPEAARPSRGSDGQIIIINPETGDEWGFWQLKPRGPRQWRAVNGYRYNIRWSGVPPTGFGSRGAKVPYLAGLIRPCEIARGKIEHAIAFAYDYPCSRENCARQGFPYFVYPATGSDGNGTDPHDFPEGARLRLDPNASEADIRKWCGNDRACRVIVKALQEYGMITIDRSGHPKIYAEDNLTARWGKVLTARTVSKIPLSAFRVLDWGDGSPPE